MKKILLITVPLNGYEIEIINSLERKGFQVDFFKEGSKISKKELTLFQRILRGIQYDLKINIFSKYMEKVENKIYKNYVEKLDLKYDYIFDFGGKAKENCLKILKEKYKCNYILYMWDDLKYAKTVWKTMNYYDKKYIFNQIDTKENNFYYRANFFVNEYMYKGEEKSIDIYYRGSLRDRKRTIILEAIEKELKDYKLDISLYAKGNYLKNIKKIHSKKYFEKKCDFLYTNLKELAEKYKKSKILLDIAYKNQSGLGLRPLEAIAANCKLITTNPNIINYEFYNGNNIFYLKDDLSNIGEIKEFIKIPMLDYSEDIKYKYSVDGFVDEIFG